MLLTWDVFNDLSQVLGVSRGRSHWSRLSFPLGSGKGSGGKAMAMLEMLSCRCLLRPESVQRRSRDADSAVTPERAATQRLQAGPQRPMQPGGLTESVLQQKTPHVVQKEKRKLKEVEGEDERRRKDVVVGDGSGMGLVVFL